MLLIPSDFSRPYLFLDLSVNCITKQRWELCFCLADAIVLSYVMKNMICTDLCGRTV